MRLRDKFLTSGADRVESVIEEIEYGRTDHLPGVQTVTVVLGVSWSLFQLSLPYFVRLSSDIVKAVHLSFALALALVCFPAFPRLLHKGYWNGAPSWQRHATTAGSYLVAAAAVLAAAHFALDYEGIAARQGMPIPRDYVVGIGLVLLLLEASRRAHGPILGVVAVLFVALSFCGERLPAFMAFNNETAAGMLGNLTMSTEGIYGVPLDVSANTVFLFVLLGAVLEKTGGGKYFVDLAFSLLGGFKGGPAKAAVLASGMTGLVSGSSIANTVTTGTFTIPLMKRGGYPPEKAAAVEVAASTNGQLMPPIMGAAAFLIAEYCNMQYLEVVRAAFVPAVVSYLALIYITHLEAVKLGLEGLPKEERPPFRRTFLGGLHFLVPLAMLITLLVLRYSPQFSAFWSIVVLAATILVRDQVRAWRHGQRELRPVKRALAGLRQTGTVLVDSLVTGARNMVGIGVAVAVAGIIVGVMAGPPGGVVTDVVEKLAGGNLYLILGLTAVMALVLGMGLPTTATYIVLSSLLAIPIARLARSFGIEVEPIAIHLFCFFFGILADDTPPVGLAAYAGAAIAKSDPIKTGIQGFTYDLRTALLPFMFFFNPDLLLLGITSIGGVAAVFAIGSIAMVAFTSAQQNHLVIRTHWVERIALLAVTLLLLWPQLGRKLAGIPKNSTYALGIAGFALLCAIQLARDRRKPVGMLPASTRSEISR